MCISFLAIALFQNWILFIPLNILMGLGFYMMHSTLQTQATELTGQTHLKYENPLIAKVWAFYNLGYFSIKILIQQGFQKWRAFDPVLFFAALENQNLDVVKTLRKKPQPLNLSPFPLPLTNPAFS